MELKSAWNFPKNNKNVVVTDNIVGRCRPGFCGICPTLVLNE